MPEPRSPESDAEPAVILALQPAARLRRLAASESGAAPYDFAEFRRRGELAATRPAWSPARGAALAAAVSAVLLGAVLWQQAVVAPRGLAVEGETLARNSGQSVTYAAVDTSSDRASPALVRVGSYIARNELEDRIAYFDAVLSESRVSGSQPERLAALERGRSRLVDSLQRVHYAEQLIAP